MDKEVFSHALHWARTHDIEWSDEVYLRASRKGDLEILRWARGNGCPWGKVYECFSSAFCRQNHEILNWHVTNGCSWSTETCAMAAQEGNFELLCWLHENFCPWDETTCANAAQGRYGEMLTWARKHDCSSRVYPIDVERGTELGINLEFHISSEDDDNVSSTSS
jgi:hypothetical protein